MRLRYQTSPSRHCGLFFFWKCSLALPQRPTLPGYDPFGETNDIGRHCPLKVSRIHPPLCLCEFETLPLRVLIRRYLFFFLLIHHFHMSFGDGLIQTTAQTPWRLNPPTITSRGVKRSVDEAGTESRLRMELSDHTEKLKRIGFAPSANPRVANHSEKETILPRVCSIWATTWGHC